MSESEILEAKKVCLLEAGKYSNSVEQLIETYNKLLEAIGLKNL